MLPLGWFDAFDEEIEDYRSSSEMKKAQGAAAHGTGFRRGMYESVNNQS